MVLGESLAVKVQKAWNEGQNQSKPTANVRPTKRTANSVQGANTVGQYLVDTRMQLVEMATEAIKHTPYKFYMNNKPLKLNSDWAELGVYHDSGKYRDRKSALRDTDLNTEIMALYKGYVIWPRVNRYEVTHMSEKVCEQLFEDSIHEMYIYRVKLGYWDRVVEKRKGSGNTAYIRDFDSTGKVKVEFIANDSFTSDTVFMDYNDFVDLGAGDIDTIIPSIDKAIEEKEMSEQKVKYGIYESQILPTRGGTRYAIRNILSDGSAIIELESDRKYYKVSNREAKFGNFPKGMKELTKEEFDYYIRKIKRGKDPNYVPTSTSVKEEKQVEAPKPKSTANNRYETMLGEFYTIKSIDTVGKVATILFDEDTEEQVVPLDDLKRGYPMSIKLAKEADKAKARSEAKAKEALAKRTTEKPVKKPIENSSKKSAYGLEVGQRLKSNSGVYYTVVDIKDSNNITIKFDGDNETYVRTAYSIRIGAVSNRRSTPKRKVTKKDINALKIGTKITLSDGHVVVVVKRFPSTSEVQIMNASGIRIIVDYAQLMSGKRNFSRAFSKAAKEAAAKAAKG